MTSYPIHTVESAPDASKPALAGLQQAFGLVPNLAATMANAPALVNSFVAVFGQFAGTSFTGAQRQALLLTNAVTNRCPWAVAFHSTMALKEGAPAAVVEAIRRREEPADPTFAALSAVTRQLIEQRGHLAREDEAAFLKAGFTPEQLFEVIAGLAVSTLANYAGNVASPPLEPPFQAQAWSAEY
jgi:alkylhydroperoxidase family enzyme